MMTVCKSNLTQFILFCLLLSVGIATVVSDYAAGANPICDAPGTFVLDAQNLKAGGAAGLDFDYAFTYQDSAYNSAPLFLKKGCAGPPAVDWKFGTYSNNKFAAYQ